MGPIRVNHALRRVLRLLPPLLWMGLIFYLSSQPTGPPSGRFWESIVARKVYHVLEYGFLFLLWRFALYSGPHSITTAVVVSILYALTDELHQTLVPTRYGRATDVLIDALGVFGARYLLLHSAERFIAGRERLVKIIFNP